MSGYRLGVDIGGTFTDLVLLEESTGELRILKLPSTPSDPAIGFLRGVDRLLEQDPKLPGSLGHVVHATTVATNAIIEGNTARTALLVTRGFRDILEIARQTRPDLFDLFCEKPRPLVPRDLCFEIRERLGPGGEVLQPLNEADVDAAAAAIGVEGVESVAICFLHSYRHPEHERRAAALLQARCPHVWVSLSSEVLPEFREYRRASTTVVNAALVPIARSYLREVIEGLRARGFASSFHVMQSGGGVLAADAAAEKPVCIVESGPAAGVIAASHLAQLAGYPDVISLDMGGTTAKVSLVRGGRPRISPEFEVGAAAVSGWGSTRGRGYPIGTPVLDLVEIGAGGGSIAWIDSGGMLRVGPRSAGADPGPACYGRGGSEPTTTDANLILGRIDAEYFLGGQMALDAEGARSAMDRVARPLGISIVEAAAGIVEIADSSMVGAIRLVSTERGYDPREFSVVAFGGAGPLHANALARQLGIPRTVIPPSPGVASAVGLLLADIEHDFVMTRVQRFGEIDCAALNAILEDFVRRGSAVLGQEGIPASRRAFLPSVDVRYAGQSYELRIPVPEGTFTAEVEAAVQDRFHLEHRRSYGHAAPEEPIELVNVRLTAIGRTVKPALKRVAPQSGSVESALRTRRAVYFATRGFVPCPVYDRYRLGAGAGVLGPAVLEELDSTVIVHPDYQAVVDELGNLIITPNGQHGS